MHLKLQSKIHSIIWKNFFRIWINYLSLLLPGLEVEDSLSSFFLKKCWNRILFWSLLRTHFGSIPTERHFSYRHFLHLGRFFNLVFFICKFKLKSFQLKSAFQKWKLQLKKIMLNLAWPLGAISQFPSEKKISGFVVLFIYWHLSTQDKITKRWQKDDATLQSKVPIKVQNIWNIKSQFQKFMS